jgi:2-dehydropantoate 2-reductase
MSLRILVVGAGAIGGYLGARLSAAGRDVTFLVRPARAQKLRETGLQVISPQHGDVTVHPQLTTTAEIGAPYDAILLAVKAYGLEAALEDFAPAVGPETMILPMLNGMRHMDVLTQRFGAHRVLGGTCLVASTLDEAGRIVQLAPINQITYGETAGGITPRIQALDDTLKGAGFEALLQDDIMLRMWEKWVQLASLGAVTCLFGGPIGKIVAVPGGAEMSRAMIDECIAVSLAHGYQPSQPFLDRVLPLMVAPGSVMASSMYRDMKRGAPVEVDQILGDLIARADAKGVPVPLLRAGFVALRVYQDGLG